MQIQHMTHNFNMLNSISSEAAIKPRKNSSCKARG